MSRLKRQRDSLPCRMASFDERMASAVDNTGTKGWLVAILELGAWVGVLVTGKVISQLHPLIVSLKG